METINELIQVDRQVVAERAVIQVATQITTIELTEIIKNVHCATVQKQHKDFIRCLIANIMRAVHVWKAI